MLKPAPFPTAISRPFWEGCNQDRLVLQRCQAEGCGRHVYYPRVCCPHCGSGDLQWEAVSGRGTVTTYTVIRNPLGESFKADAPYVYGAVTLQEGPVLCCRLEVAPEAADGLIGKEVAVLFRDDQIPGQKLPFFKPAG